MSNNTTYSCLQSYCNLSDFAVHPENQSFGPSVVVALSTSIVVAVLSPVAVALNALVLSAIWRKASLRTPCYILLAGLAFTDFGTGLISQPFYVANELIRLKGTDSKPTLRIIMEAMMNDFASFFSCTTLLIITLMSVQRWLHMTRRSLITVRRTCITVEGLTGLLIPLAVCLSIKTLHGDANNLYFNFIFNALYHRHISGLLQSFSNNSASSAANSGE